MNHQLAAFETQRSRLLGLAYRITGSISDAEDIVQEAFIRWSASDADKIDSVPAWLTTVTTRLALDYLKSAHRQRESYIGPWLPEPFIAELHQPEQERELDESITMALLVLLEQLSPNERAAFILHDIFHFDFSETAAILNKSGSACRQLASRARKKIEPDKITPSLNTDKTTHSDIVAAFFSAVKDGHMQGLIELLQDNVIFHADGGGKASAASRILQGREAVIKFLIKAVSRSLVKASGQLQARQIWFNGSPGLVLWIAGEPITAFNFEIVEGCICKIHALRNPDKLRFFKQ